MTERRLDHLEIGFYKLSMAKNAPDVGAIIYIPCPIEMHPEFWQWIDRPWIVRALINGRLAEPWEIGMRPAEKITPAEYQYLIADRAWAREHAPNLPEASPTRAVGIRDVPIESLMP